MNYITDNTTAAELASFLRGDAITMNDVEGIHAAALHLATLADQQDSRIKDLEARQREHGEHMLALGKTVSLLQDHALTVGNAVDTLQNREIGNLAERVSFATHEARAKKLREAVTRVVQAIEIGDDGIDLEAAHNQLSGRPDRAGARALEETLINDLVLVVGEVLTREGS